MLPTTSLLCKINIETTYFVPDGIYEIYFYVPIIAGSKWLFSCLCRTSGGNCWFWNVWSRIRNRFVNVSKEGLNICSLKYSYLYFPSIMLIFTYCLFRQTCPVYLWGDWSCCWWWHHLEDWRQNYSKHKRHSSSSNTNANKTLHGM